MELSIHGYHNTAIIINFFLMMTHAVINLNLIMLIDNNNNIIIIIIEIINKYNIVVRRVHESVSV
jgi:hypothetical protein